MEIIEGLLTNGGSITFSMLFVGLLIYVMKTNDVREADYRKTIQDLTLALRTVDDLKVDVKEISERLRDYK